MPLYPPASSGSGAPTDAQYVTLAANGTLSAERVLTPAGHLSGTDAGAGSTYTLTGLNEQNLLINGGFDIMQRVNPTAATTLNDTAYGHFDRWYSLVQGSGATITRIAGTDNSRYSAKLVSGGTTNRFGIAQVVESYLSMPMMSRSVRFQCRIRANKNAGSGSIDIRAAILVWNSIADPDNITVDLVNDWTSSTYTTGNFFTATVYDLVATAQISASHNTWTDLAVTGTIPATASNIFIFVWNEDVPAHASDFWEICEAGLYDGTTARPWMPRPIQTELALCQRYCWAHENNATATGAVAGRGTAFSTTQATAIIHLGVPMRAVPSITATATDWYATDSVTATDLTALTIGSGTTTSKIIQLVMTVASGLTQYRTYALQADGTTTRRLILEAEIE